MTESAQQPPQPLSPMFIWAEMNRRLDAALFEFRHALEAITQRVDRMDEGGTRGVDLLRVELRQLRTDLEEHEKSHAQAAEQQRQDRAQQRADRRWVIGLAFTVALALIANLVAILIAGKG